MRNLKILTPPIICTVLQILIDYCRVHETLGAQVQPDLGLSVGTYFDRIPPSVAVSVMVYPQDVVVQGVRSRNGKNRTLISSCS